MSNSRSHQDVLIIGAGHNALAASVFLARKGLKVTVLEKANVIGGATRTEKPFLKAPDLATSTGSYLLGVMPPEILSKLGARVELIRRDPHYFLPTLDKRYLLFGSNKAEMKNQFLSFFSEKDWLANECLQDEISQLRDDLAPSWLEEPISCEETAEKYIRPQLRKIFVDLVKNPVEQYLSRFEFQSELLMAMYAVTDGFSGLTGSFGTPGTGMNFLVHNMCRLPGSDGTFMIVKGGMGAIATEFARLATEAGVEIKTNAPVSQIMVSGGKATGVVLKSGLELTANTVLAGCDPFTLQDLVGEEKFSKNLNEKLSNSKRMGTTLKVNFALDRLPTFKCLPENKGQHSSTIHLLPQVNKVMDHIRHGFEQVMQGELAQFPTIEWYIHTGADPSLQDNKGHHNSAFFVQWVPHTLKNSTWEKEEKRYVDHLISIADQFAPGFSDSIVDTFTLTPPKVETYFGIKHGHIHHIDNTIGFDDRMPYATGIEGLYSCSAGCHPAGSVLGAAGHNAAGRVLRDLDLA